ncbi:hypothetical protein ACIGXM_14645 [Kitasatospora sp. NPDC052896]|uniref:hypothetical protein n=1 Tax=Kitasatospora sp. NPDC052896 TaxID=3364061 RepID=UPI0037C6FD4D
MSLPAEAQMRPDDTSPPFADGTPWHPHYENQLRFLNLTLISKPDERCSQIGFVMFDTSGFGTTAATVYYNQDRGKFWANLWDNGSTRLRENVQQVLEDVARVYLLGSLGEKHPILAAAYAHARQRKEERHRAHAQVPEGKNAHQYKKVQLADAAEQEAMDMLAVVLDAAGYDMAGYDGRPSADLARPQLDRWIERKETAALRRALGQVDSSG